MNSVAYMNIQTVSCSMTYTMLHLIAILNIVFITATLKYKMYN